MYFEDSGIYYCYTTDAEEQQLEVFPVRTLHARGGALCLFAGVDNGGNRAFFPPFFVSFLVTLLSRSSFFRTLLLCMFGGGGAILYPCLSVSS